MKSATFFGFTAAAAVTWGAVSCIDFDASQQAYCEKLSCHARALVCQDGPQITARSPEKDSRGVPLDASVVVTFSVPVTCTDSGVTLVQYTTQEPAVPGESRCTGNNLAVFMPTVPLQTGRQYKVYVADCQVFNDAGLGVPDASWTFTAQ